ncbi:SAF domain-containing protein [Oceanobacillus luteolus]|uniref:SAF domain-containing protein n=1 Tax=Oceanobacillus luteolus TaxID=1274358 RepID=A0ABW4HXA2_9BACI
MKKFLTIILSVVIIIAGFGTVIVFDRVKASYNHTEVIVASKDIMFKEEITADHLAVLEIPTNTVLENAFTPEQADDIIGSYAANTIPAGQQINPTLLDVFDLIPNEEKGEFIAAIPEDWLFTVPQSLRKSYLADFYVVATDEKRMIESMGSGQQEHFITNDRLPILQNIRISSVKNSSNAEVETVISEDKTESTTGTISNLEIIANQEILDALRSVTESGYTLYVVYTLERDGNEGREVIINQNELPEKQEEENEDESSADDNEEESEE